MALFLIHSHYLSNAFTVDKEVIVIDDDSEEEILVKKKSKKNIENVPQQVLIDKRIYDELLSKARRDENLSFVQEITSKYKESLDLNKKKS